MTAAGHDAGAEMGSMRWGAPRGRAGQVSP
jgi:hypothetical protein